jgi:2-polyprenyl-3-methyl-5-hydroxy-6-metoxy-1,4-benzoquinol methylase
MELRESFMKLIVSEKQFPSKSNLQFYLRYIFEGIDAEGKSVLDVGGGIGLLSLYAAINGAKRTVCLEPELDGSTKGFISNFTKLKNALDVPLNVEQKASTLQDFMVTNKEKFDIVIMHNVINHLNEHATIHLRHDNQSRIAFLKVFFDVYDMMNPNGVLIITDCTNRNFFDDLGMKSPFARTIEWEKHQTPQTWAKLICKCGFIDPEIKYSSPNTFGRLGRVLMGNRVASYMTSSLFKVNMKVGPPVVGATRENLITAGFEF